ncbi:hypothetical protein HK099_000723 [Clydaea vesicula]|uniref:Pyrroline-5-carboxylate reductase n=1 Tax=Clydaea vesicula TaxID=447962 RepID=A0AAD5Y235_9FUNG|nr:hypothetical protein HK099_000723 [Clydaea vesicula]KAJ3376475.1 hypothetical protein HDU92_000295 [Lobulomyces angularis]
MGLKVGIIGGGNMANAIIGGLIQKGFNAKDLAVSEPDVSKLHQLRDKFGINVSTDNNDLVNFKFNNSNNCAGIDIIILAVKPQIMNLVAQGISKTSQNVKPLVISIAAGVLLKDLKLWIGKDVSIVRCMPNTPALLGEAATVFFGDTNVSKRQKDAAELVLASVSRKVYWVEKEHLLDVVTGVSGSGPAYFFLLIECLENAGVKLGLPNHIARGLAIQTCLGAGKMASESDVSPAELRKRVTSPNGTTEAAIKVAKNNKIENLWFTVVKSASDRAAELGKELSSKL